MPLAGGALVLLMLGGAAVHLPGEGNPGSEDRQQIFVSVGLVAVAVYFLAVARVLRRPLGDRALWLVLGVACAMRLVTLVAPPFLSSDVYRYVWDGRVQNAGINPYLMVPADPALRSLRDGAIFPRINRADYASTVYPPMAQLIFRVVGWFGESVLAMKLAMLGFDIVAMLAMLWLLGRAGLDRCRVLIYAWNPVVAWEFAGNAHIDAAVIGFVALAMVARVAGRRVLAGAILGAAVLTKFFPLALFPAFWRWRERLAMPAVLIGIVVLCYLPFVGAGMHLLGFLPGYVQEEHLVGGSGIYWLDLLGRVVALPDYAGAVWVGVAGLGLAALAGWMLFFRDEAPSLVLHPVTVGRDVAVLMTAVVVAVTPHYTWYFVWLALPACLAAYPSVIYLSVAAIVQYHDPFDGALPAFSIIYLPFVVLLQHDLRRSAARSF